MNEEFEAAYRTADYCLWLAGNEIVLRVDNPAPDALAVLTARLNLKDAAYIVTPCNPRSQRLEDAENRALLAEFRGKLNFDGIRSLPSVNRDPDREWPDEPGALLLDCGRNYARKLGEQYRQNAIVEFGMDATPKLIML